MGLTYAYGFLKSHIVDSSNLVLLEKSPEKAKQLETLSIGKIYGTPGDYIKSVDLIVLAVKPQDIDLLFKSIKSYIADEQLVLSIMAGVNIDRIIGGLGVSKVIRAMPNLPAQIGLGMTVYTSSNDVTRIELVTVQNLLSSSGKTIYVEDESMIDAATAISGSGPAYVFYFMQALIEKAMEMGFSHAESELLTFQTFRGAVDLFNKHEITCQEWIERVSSRGGTTEAAFEGFSKYDVQSSFKKGVQKALERAKELSLS